MRHTTRPAVSHVQILRWNVKRSRNATRTN